MKILIPMAGEGQRFKQEGYTVSKPSIPTYNRRNGDRVPMVVCATLDLPDVNEDGSNVIYVGREFHKSDGTADALKKYYPYSTFITVNHLTEGQACTCLLAEDYIYNDDELLIAGCDNGMEFDRELFEQKKQSADMLVFTYRHNVSVLENPNAYGWMVTEGSSDIIIDASIKKAISDTPMQDHAVVATFWFRKGSLFVDAAKKMMKENDRINNEFYVDEVVKHILEMGYCAKVMEVDRYIGWGTPTDYEAYQNTFEYWNGFYERERLLN